MVNTGAFVICVLLKELFGITTFSPLQHEWIEPDHSLHEHEAQIAVPQKYTYTFAYDDSGKTVDIQLASIHSVK